MEINFANYGDLAQSVNRLETYKTNKEIQKNEFTRQVVNTAIQKWTTSQAEKAKLKAQQDNAEQALIKDELTEAISGMDVRFDDSLQKHTSYQDANSGQWVTDANIAEYRDTALNSIFSRNDISDETKEWAKAQIDNRYRYYDEVGLNYAFKEKAGAKTAEFKDDVDTSLKLAVNTRDFSIVEQALRRNNVNPESDYGIYLSNTLKREYDKGVTEENIRYVAQNKGFGEAQKAIENLNELTTAEKDNLTNKASKWASNMETALSDRTQKYTVERLANNALPTEIYADIVKNSDESGLTPYMTNIAINSAKQEIRRYISNQVDPVISQIKNEQLTPEEISIFAEELKNNKAYFNGLELKDNGKGVFADGSNMDLYEEYKGLLEDELADYQKILDAQAKASEEKANNLTKEIKEAKNDFLDKYNQGIMSGSEVLDSYETLVKNAIDYDPNDKDKVAYIEQERSAMAFSLRKKLPEELYDIVKEDDKKFRTLWAEKFGFMKKGKIDSTIDNDKAFIDALHWRQGAIADIAMDNGDMTYSDYEEKLKQIDNTFFGKYMDNIAIGGYTGRENLRGLKRILPEMSGRQEELQNNKPVYYDQSANLENKLKWNTPKQKELFDNVWLAYRDVIDDMLGLLPQETNGNKLEVIKTDAPHPYLIKDKSGLTVDVLAIPVYTLNNGSEIAIYNNEIHKIEKGILSDKPISVMLGNNLESSNITNTLVANKQIKEDEKKVQNTNDFYLNRTRLNSVL